MAIRENKITNTGRRFIEKVVADGGLLSGTNGPMPFSDDGAGNKVDKTWVVNAIGSDDKPLNNDNLAQSLITWFERYAEMYELDPNILAAQAYVDSRYRLWYYSNGCVPDGGWHVSLRPVFCRGDAWR